MSPKVAVGNGESVGQIPSDVEPDLRNLHGIDAGRGSPETIAVDEVARSWPWFRR